MEALDLAVGLGPVGAGAFVDGAGVFEGVAPFVAAVAAAVVAEQALHSNAPGVEPVVGAPLEPCGDVAGLVCEYL